jgi:hypothetical protein
MTIFYARCLGSTEDRNVASPARIACESSARDISFESIKMRDDFAVAHTTEYQDHSVLCWDNKE